MDYLAKVTIEGVVYEAHVDVREYDGELDAELCTNFAYVDDEIVIIEEMDEYLQQTLIDEAADMYRMDDGADAAYDAMRDA